MWKRKDLCEKKNSFSLSSFSIHTMGKHFLLWKQKKYTYENIQKGRVFTRKDFDREQDNNFRGFATFLLFFLLSREGDWLVKEKFAFSLSLSLSLSSHDLKRKKKEKTHFHTTKIVTKKQQCRVTNPAPPNEQWWCVHTHTHTHDMDGVVQSGQQQRQQQR